MKQYLTIVLVVAAFIFISPFSVSAATEKEWSQKLDLSDSVSTSVIKLDDGIVVMKYEGSASENSTLTKYDFNGNEVWSIKNEYGYEMGALGDGFIVYASDVSMTKISSDGEVLWSKELGYFYTSQVIDLDTGFLIVSDETIYRYDDNGNLLKSLSKRDVFLSVSGNGDIGKNFAVSLSNDKKSILVFITWYQNITGGLNGNYHAVAEYSLNLDYKSSTISYTGYPSYDILTKMVETENNYIITGAYTMVFNKKGQIDKVLNLSVIDIQYINGDIYVYATKKSDNYCIYDTFAAKYDENMNLITNYSPFYSFDVNNSYEKNYCKTSEPLATTSFASIKNRSIFYQDSNGVHFVILNSSLFANVISGQYAIPTNSNYSVLQYRLTDDNSNSAITDDGIIDNIFENPETSSIAVVIAFVVVILLGGIGFYFGYKKKKAKNM